MAGVRQLGRRSRRRGLALPTCVALALAALALAGRAGEPPAAAQGLPEPASLPGRWHTFANGDDVLSIAVGRGAIWAGTRAGGLVRWDPATGEYVQFLAPQTPLGGNTVHDLAIDAGGRVWAATSGGLTVLNDNGTPGSGDDTWRNYVRANTFGGLPSDDLRAVAVDGNTVWVAGVQEWDGGSREWRGGGLGRLDTLGTPQTNDDVWMSPATFESTRRVAPDGEVTLGLVSDNILDLQVTQDGVWLATSSHWRLERTADPSGTRTWQQVHGGMSHLAPAGTFDTADDSWTAYSCEDPLTDTDGRPVVACTMADLDLDPAGRIWAAAGGMGVVAFPSSRPVLTPGVVFRFQAADGLGANFVDGIDAGAGGDTVWFATREAGVRALAHGPSLRDKRDDVWRAFSVDEGMPRRRVQAVVVTEGTAAAAGMEGAASAAGPEGAASAAGMEGAAFASAAGETGAHSPDQTGQRVWVGTGPQAGVGGGLATFLATAEEVERVLITAAPSGRAPVSNFVTSLAAGPIGSPWEGKVVAGTGSRTQRTFGAGLMVLSPGDAPLGADDEVVVHTAAGTDDDGEAPFTGLAGDNVHAVAIDGERLWVGSATVTWDGAARKYIDGGLAVLDGAEWTARTPENSGGAVSDDGVSALALGCDGDVWLGSGSEWGDGRGVSMLTAPASDNPATDTWEQAEFPELASNEVQDIDSCKNGAMWVASRYHNLAGGWSDGGVAHYDTASSAWTRYDETNGYNTYAAGRIKGVGLAVAAAPSGDVWAGAYGTKEMPESSLVGQAPYWPATVNRLHDGVWSYTTFAGTGAIGSLLITDAGEVWAGTTRGGAARDSVDPGLWRDDRYLPGLLIWSEAAGWRSIDARTGGLPASDISAIAGANGRRVWVATEGWGMSLYDPNAVAPTPSPTNDAPSPTPTQTPTASATPRITPSPSPTGPTRTPTRETTPGTREYKSHLPIVFQR